MAYLPGEVIKLSEYKTLDDKDMSLSGAFPDGGVLAFYVKPSVPAERVTLVIHADGWNSGETVCVKYPLELINGEFVLRIETGRILADAGLRDSGLFYYHYAVNDGRSGMFFGGEHPTELEMLNDSSEGERQLLIYSKDYRTSERFTEGVMYHIFVDRFRKSGKCPVRPDAVLDDNWESGIPQYGEYPGAEIENNVFFGGDLWGAAEKLDYIAELGVSTVYLSPVFEAYSNHKYDTGDYMKVDDMFGGEEALKYLCSEAGKRGIGIILDGVFNHTGSDSVYFNKNGRYGKSGAYNDRNSPYSGWYRFREYPDDYECWWGVKTLPRADTSNAEYTDFICGNVIPKWMRDGVSGWRLDVADELDERFIAGIRNTVKKEKNDAVIIGEVWEDATDKVSYGKRRRYLQGSELDSVMNYPLRDAVIGYVTDGRTEELRRCTEGMYRRYPKCSIDNLMNFLGTHDTERILSVLGGDVSGGRTNAELAVSRMNDEQRKKAVSRLKLAWSIIAGLPGVPCIFYGDEAGIEGYRDPFCRKPFPWKNINEELLNHYRTTGKLRHDIAVFRHGGFRILSLDENTFVYERFDDDVSAVIASSRSGDTVVLDNEYTNLISGEKSSSFTLKACGSVWLIRKK